MSKQKVLIIKPGYSETLDHDDSNTVSLGDILRSTVILNLFPPESYEVTWLVDKRGVQLLKGNPYIHKLLVCNGFTSHYLLYEKYDILINLEKDVGICAMCERIQAWERYGFRLRDSDVNADEYSQEAFKFTNDLDAKRNKNKSWSEVLFEMLGETYSGEPLILGYKPKTKDRYQVGLNHQIGKKFPTKAWCKEKWEMLDIELSVLGYSKSWQQGESDLELYIDWLASCDLVVTNDSLGLHIALALNKKVIALFGPTLASEVHDCNNLVKIVSDTGNVKDISVDQVLERVELFNVR